MHHLLGAGALLAVRPLDIRYHILADVLPAGWLRLRSSRGWSGRAWRRRSPLLGASAADEVGRVYHRMGRAYRWVGGDLTYSGVGGGSAGDWAH